MTVTPDHDSRMLTALVQLHDALKAAPLALDVPGAAELRVSRQQLIEQLEDYVLPRQMTVEAPLLAVVGGSTGAGKSTLVNSLVGRRVTAPGL
ncbi:ABC transporter, partial [Nocardioides hankookensis]